LADKLESVGRQLDAGYFSSLESSILVTERIIIDQRVTESVAKEHCRLVGVWESLVERIRQLPRFKYFLKPNRLANSVRLAPQDKLL
jgi:hypothetical protein